MLAPAAGEIRRFPRGDLTTIGQTEPLTRPPRILYSASTVRHDTDRTVSGFGPVLRSRGTMPTAGVVVAVRCSLLCPIRADACLFGTRPWRDAPPTRRPRIPYGATVSQELGSADPAAFSDGGVQRGRLKATSAAMAAMISQATAVDRWAPVGRGRRILGPLDRAAAWTSLTSSTTSPAIQKT
jgi:hypothetical protein